MLLLSATCPRPFGRWKTPYERRFGGPCEGPITPFGAMVEYHPSSPKDQSRLHQFGLIAGGIWKGDILTADLEDLEN